MLERSFQATESAALFCCLSGHEGGCIIREKGCSDHGQ